MAAGYGSSDNVRPCSPALPPSPRRRSRCFGCRSTEHRPRTATRKPTRGSGATLPRPPRSTPKPSSIVRTRQGRPEGGPDCAAAPVGGPTCAAARRAAPSASGLGRSACFEDSRRRLRRRTRRPVRTCEPFAASYWQHLGVFNAVRVRDAVDVEGAAQNERNRKFVAHAAFMMFARVRPPRWLSPAPACPPSEAPQGCSR